MTVRKQIAADLGDAVLPLLEQLLGDVNTLVTRGAVRIGGAELRPLPAAGGRIVASACRLAGFSLYATTAATVFLSDGETGDVTVPISLSAGESVRDPIPRPGWAFPNGIYAVVTGTVIGSIAVYPGQVA